MLRARRFGGPPLFRGRYRRFPFGLGLLSWLLPGAAGFLLGRSLAESRGRTGEREAELRRHEEELRRREEELRRREEALSATGGGPSVT